MDLLRDGKKVSYPYITKQLFNSVVRSILECNFIVWNPFYSIHSDRMESGLKSRRAMLTVLLMNNLINGIIRPVKFNVPCSNFC